MQTSNLPNRNAQNPRVQNVEDKELSFAESFLDKLRSNQSFQPVPTVNNFPNGKPNEQKKISPRVSSRGSSKQTSARSQCSRQGSRGGSRGSQFSNQYDDNFVDDEVEDNLTARARRWSNSERSDGWKWSGRPMHRDALGNVVLKQAEQAESLRKTKQGLDDLEQDAAAFDIYLRAANIVQKNQILKKNDYDSDDNGENSSSSSSEGEDIQLKNNAIDDDDGDDEEEKKDEDRTTGFFITEVAGQRASYGNEEKGKKQTGRCHNGKKHGLVVDEEGETVDIINKYLSKDVELAQGRSSQPSHQNEEEFQYRTCLDVRDQTKKRVERQVTRPQSPDTLKLFEKAGPKRIEKLQRRVRGAPGSAPAAMEMRGAPACIERAADAHAKLNLIKEREELALKRAAKFKAMPIPDIGLTRRRRGGPHVAHDITNAAGYAKTSIVTQEGSKEGKQNEFQMDCAVELTLEEKKARRAADRKARAEAAKILKEQELQLDNSQQKSSSDPPDKQMNSPITNQCDDDTVHFDYYAEACEDNKPLFERQTDWGKHIKSRRAREQRKKKQREEKLLKEEIEEEKKRRELSMHYWSRAQDLAAQARLGEEQEEEERERAAEQRRKALKAKADELALETATKRKAKKDTAQIEARRIEAAAKLRRQEESQKIKGYPHSSAAAGQGVNLVNPAGLTIHATSQPAGHEQLMSSLSQAAPLTMAEKAELEMELFLRQHQWLETGGGDGVAQDLSLPMPSTKASRRMENQSIDVGSEGGGRGGGEITETNDGGDDDYTLDVEQEGDAGYAKEAFRFDPQTSSPSQVTPTRHDDEDEEKSPTRTFNQLRTTKVSPIQSPRRKDIRRGVGFSVDSNSLNNGFVPNKLSTMLENMDDSKTSRDREVIHATSSLESPPLVASSPSGTSTDINNQGVRMSTYLESTPSRTVTSTSTTPSIQRISRVDPDNSVNLMNVAVEPWERFDRSRATEAAIGGNSHQMPFFDLSSTSERGRFRVHDARGFDSDTLKRLRLPDAQGITLLVAQRHSGHAKYPNSEQVVTVMFDRDPNVDAETSASDAERWWHRNKSWLVLPNPLSHSGQ